MFSQGLLLTFSQPGCLEMHGEQFAVLEKFLLDKYLKFTKLICLLSMLNLLVWMFWVGQLQSKLQRGVQEIFIPARLQGKCIYQGKKLASFKAQRKQSNCVNGPVCACFADTSSESSGYGSLSKYGSLNSNPGVVMSSHHSNSEKGSGKNEVSDDKSRSRSVRCVLFLSQLYRPRSKGG